MSFNSPILAALPLHWESPVMFPVAAAVAAALFAAVVWLYPAQVRQVRRPWRWVLPALRATALLVLAVSLARPIAVRARAADERAAVLVLFDRSRSMGVSDVPADPAALVALADGMGMLPPGVRAAVTAQLGRELEELKTHLQDVSRAAADLDYARVSGHGIAPAEQRLRDAVDRYAWSARAMAGRVNAVPEGSGLRQRLRALANLPKQDARGQWIVEVGQRIEELSNGVNTYRNATDRKLYDADAEVRAACDLLRGHSRLDLAREAMLRPGTGLVARLADAAPAQGFTFADTLVPLGPLHAAAATTQPSPGPPWAEPGAGVAPQDVGDADGHETDVAGAVATALARAEPGGVRAVVVCSDGRQVGPEGANVAALAAAGVPVFTVLASAGRAPDLSFATVAARDAVYLGETLTVRAELSPGGKGGRTGEPPAPKADLSAVRLAVGDAAPLAPARVDEPRRAVEFTVKMDQPGAQRLVVFAPPAPGELTDENNRVRRWVKVLPGRIRVAAYASDAGWDFQYLRGALARAPGIALDAGVLDPASPKLPLTPEQILNQDVIVLADVPVGALDEAQWQAVNTLVTKRGGSAVLVAGDDHALGDYARHWAAAELLPWKAHGPRPSWRVWPGERPNFRPVPAPGFERSDVLQLIDGDVNNRRWYDLPALYRVLATPELKDNVRPLLVEPDLGAAVLTEARPGLGRALLLGTNETWRWRLRSGERDQDRFWRQLIHFAAEQPYATRGGALALDLDKVAAAPGEPVHVRARAFDEQLVAAGPDAFRLEVVRDDDASTGAGGGGPTVRSQTVSATIAGSGRFAATLDGLPAGDYQVQLVGPTPDGGRQRLSVPLRVEPSFEAEMQNVHPDADRLQRLAQATGGQMLRVDELQRLPDLVRAAGDDRPRLTEMPLWDSPYLFVFVLACFGAEWALRKRFGLA